MAEKGAARGGCCSLFVPSAGNFAIQWNFAVLSIVVAIMTARSGGYTEPHWAKYTLLGTVFAGAMVGMISMGALGDALGRRLGMATTLSLVVAGALGSALLPWGDGDELFGVLAACRFVLGVGVGGIYPMSAAIAAASKRRAGADDAADAADSSTSLVEVTSEYAAHFYDMYVEGHTGKHLTGDRIRILLLNLPFLFRDLIAPEVMFPSTFRQSCLYLV